MRNWVGVLLLAGASSLTAQRAQIQPPDVVVREFFDAIEKARFVEAARHLDTLFFAQSKRSLLETYRMPRIRTPLSADQLMKQDPEMPRAVAEYYVKQSERSALSPEFDELEFTYADVPDTVALKLLSARELAARWLEARDFRYMVRMSLRSNHCRQSTNVPVDSVLNEVPVPTREILGVIRRRDTAYVLFRHTMKSAEPHALGDQPSVLTLVLRDRWRVAPSEFGPTNIAFGCG